MTLEILDAKGHAALVQGIIGKYGDGPEHHYHYYIDEEEEGYVPQVIHDAGKGYCILGLHDTQKEEWTLHAEPLCPVSERAALLHRVALFLFSRGAKRITVEVRPQLRNALIEIARQERSRKGHVVKICKINYALDWPVYLLDSWMGDTLQGGAWKDMRYYINVFKKSNPSAAVVQASAVPQEELLKLVKLWKRTRAKRHEHTPTAFLDNAIKAGFAGFDEARVVLIEGKPAAITAGFKVDHTLPHYYSSIGIYDQRYPRLGEFANWDDLCNLKRKGYTRVDFGGGDESLNTFKKKFHPTLMYTTQIFSIKPVSEHSANR